MQVPWSVHNSSRAVHLGFFPLPVCTRRPPVALGLHLCKTSFTIKHNENPLLMSLVPGLWCISSAASTISGVLKTGCAVVVLFLFFFWSTPCPPQPKHQGGTLHYNTTLNLTSQLSRCLTSRGRSQTEVKSATWNELILTFLTSLVSWWASVCVASMAPPGISYSNMAHWNTHKKTCPFCTCRLD